MPVFLKQQRIVTELAKGVASMKQFIYPSILQKQAIPAIKQSQTNNVILHYQELSGVKLTVFLPILDDLLKTAIKNSVSEG
jgi:hypothetical protein